MKSITSADNPTYKRLLSLNESAGVRKYGEFLLAGRKLVPEFITSEKLHLKALIRSPDLPEIDAGLLPIIEVSKAMFKELDHHGTHYPIIWGATPALPEHDLSKPPLGFELVLALSNPLNLGAALRSAEAFSVDTVVLLTECANAFMGKTLRSSSGSSLRLNLAFGPSAKQLVAHEAFWALDMKGQDIRDFKFAKDFRLLIGEEGMGVPRGFSADKKLAIPIHPGMDSLNAVAAASIALFAFRSQNRLKK